MNCHGENTLQPTNKGMDFLNSCRISGHFGTTFTTIAQIKQILQESKDPKIDNILNLERVYFLMTRVMSCTCMGLNGKLPKSENTLVLKFNRHLILMIGG